MLPRFDASLTRAMRQMTVRIRHEERHGWQEYGADRGEPENEGEHQEPHADPAGHVHVQAADVLQLGLLQQPASPLGAARVHPGVEDQPGVGHVERALAALALEEPGAQLHRLVRLEDGLVVGEAEHRRPRNGRGGRRNDLLEGLERLRVGRDFRPWDACYRAACRRADCRRAALEDDAARGVLRLRRGAAVAAERIGRIYLLAALCACHLLHLIIWAEVNGNAVGNGNAVFPDFTGIARSSWPPGRAGRRYRAGKPIAAPRWRPRQCWR